MSYLQSQLNAFKSDISSSSSKLSSKRTLSSQPVSTPSPAGSINSNSTAKEGKRKRPADNNVVYSQPAETGFGREVMTQVTYAIDYLKAKEAPQTFQQIVGYLSLQHQHPDDRKRIRAILNRHPRIEYDPNASDGQGTYSYKPTHNIRSADDLLRHLQTQPSAQGLLVRELKDGWGGAEDAIDKLEAESKILVTRNKKDNHARMVWADDPSLSQHIDPEFQSLWHKITLPTTGDLSTELEKANLTPTSKNRGGVVPKHKEKEKARKKPRKGGRTTNLHMLNILKDYSHVRK